MIEPEKYGLHLISRSQMGILEGYLETCYGTGDAVLDRSIRSIVSGDGKRLRPLLVLAFACAAGAPDLGAVKLAAAAIELLHVGSLVHDDILDDASHRRGQPTVHQQIGVHRAILAGDYLFARAGELAAQAGLLQSRYMQAAFTDMCIGQIREASVVDASFEVSDEQFLAYIEGKTGAVLAAACAMGSACAVSVAASPLEPQAASNYGRLFGVAFQMVDDILDVIGDPVIWNKPVEQDIGIGLATVPMQLAVAEDPNIARLAREDPDEAYRRLRRGPYVTRAVERAMAVSRQAGEALGKIDNVPELVQLAQLPATYVSQALDSYTAGGYRDLVRQARSQRNVEA